MTNPSVPTSSESVPHKIQTQWVHVFKSMIDGGYVAEIGPLAFTVYAVIKSYANFDSGEARPGIELISKLSGISCAQVKRELKVLEDAGFIAKKKLGRSNLYTLVEKLKITDQQGHSQGEARWTYIPCRTSAAIGELKRCLNKGNLADLKTVHIEHLNVQINLGPQSMPPDLETLARGLDSAPASIRKILLSKLKGSESPRQGSD